MQVFSQNPLQVRRPSPGRPGLERGTRPPPLGLHPLQQIQFRTHLYHMAVARHSYSLTNITCNELWIFELFIQLIYFIL